MIISILLSLSCILISSFLWEVDDNKVGKNFFSEVKPPNYSINMNVFSQFLVINVKQNLVGTYFFFSLFLSLSYIFLEWWCLARWLECQTSHMQDKSFIIELHMCPLISTF